MINKKPNKLINQKSPYLLQHAHNPVDWYPWGAEAFQNAKTEDKPIFLSIGYSTCHWCHVMERESFEDQDVAQLLNKSFVSIKVDREERPDVDAVYMQVCQALTGQGGWPLTIIMTPDQKPFFAATYLPKSTRYNMVGMMELLPQVTKLWKSQRDKLLKTGDELSNYLANHTEGKRRSAEPAKDLIYDAAGTFSHNFDKQNGGFGSAPKFPTPHNLMFLMQYSLMEHDISALEMVEKTLEQMMRGGIFDHIGGGFSRYSTDDKWLVPHFEKMLYDNALLTIAYLKAYQITKKQLYRNVAFKTINYVLRELTDESGGFYCGQDADSEGVEGKYYVFTPKEVQDVLGNTDGDTFNKWFDITDKGNFEGESIPNLLKNNNFSNTKPEIDRLCNSLYNYRLNRTVLHKDDKILTSWNALMIAALAESYCILGDISYLNAAEKAHSFISDKLIKNGQILVRYRDLDAAEEGKIDDYAFYIFALLQLYDASYKAEYLKEALDITNQMIENFYDNENGGFYLYSKTGEQLISRPKEIYDGAMPSGNSVASFVLVKIAKLTGEPKWQEIADKQLKFIAGNINEYPAGYSFSLLAVMAALYPSKELICVTTDKALANELRKMLAQKPVANITVLSKTPENENILKSIAPYTADYPIKNSDSTFYLCQNGSCSAPIQIIEKLIEMLK